MELWIILLFLGALVLIGLLFWDAKRRSDKRVRNLRRLQDRLRESGAAGHPGERARRVEEPSDSPPDSQGSGD